MTDELKNYDPNPLTYEAEPGAEVEVQSNESTETFDAVVDEDRKVRAESNGATFNRDNYTVVFEK